MTAVTDVPTQSPPAGITRYLAPVLVFLFAAAAFGVSAPLDPEPHHDGVQLAPAIAVSGGLWIHLEVFDQYGPITAWLHGLAILVMGPTLLSLRIFTAVVLSLSALLLYFLARRVTSSRVAAVGVSILWVVLWPGRSIDSVTNALLPWPSTTFLLAQLGAAILAVRFIQEGCRKPWQMVPLGALLGLAVLIRLNYGLPLIVMVVVAFVILRLNGARMTAPAWGWLAIGTALPIVLVLGVLVSQGSLQYYVAQAFVGPLGGQAIVAATPWFYLKNVYLLGSIPLVLVLAVTYVVVRIRGLATWLLSALVAVAVGSLMVWASMSIPGSPFRDLILSRLTWAPALDAQAAQPMYLAAVVTPFAFIVVAAIWLRRALARQRVSKDLSVFGLLVLLAVSAMVQLFPVADPYHLWWSAPILLLLLAHLLTRGESRRIQLAMIVVLALPYVVIGVPRAVAYVSEDRKQISEGVLAGMFARSQVMTDIQDVDAILLGTEPRSARFLCQDGVFSVWTGSYLSDSPAFVDWAFGLPPAAGTEPTREFVCLTVAPGEPTPEYTPPTGWIVERMAGPINISYFNSMYLVELSRS